MKTQIIRRLSLSLITILFALSSNNGSTIQPSIKINCICVQTNQTETKNVITSKGDFTTARCHGCIHINQNETPEIPEPNGDHEIHSFHFDHNKRSFWKKAANKILTAVYYLVVLISCIPYKL